MVVKSTRFFKTVSPLIIIALTMMMGPLEATALGDGSWNENGWEWTVPETQEYQNVPFSSVNLQSVDPELGTFRLRINIRDGESLPQTTFEIWGGQDDYRLDSVNLYHQVFEPGVWIEQAQLNHQVEWVERTFPGQVGTTIDLTLPREVTNDYGNPAPVWYSIGLWFRGIEAQVPSHLLAYNKFFLAIAEIPADLGPTTPQPTATPTATLVPGQPTSTPTATPTLRPTSTPTATLVPNQPTPTPTSTLAPTATPPITISPLPVYRMQWTTNLLRDSALPPPDGWQPGTYSFSGSTLTVIVEQGQVQSFLFNLGAEFSDRLLIRANVIRRNGLSGSIWLGGCDAPYPGTEGLSSWYNLGDFPLNQAVPIQSVIVPHNGNVMPILQIAGGTGKLEVDITGFEIYELRGEMPTSLVAGVAASGETLLKTDYGLQLGISHISGSEPAQQWYGHNPASGPVLLTAEVKRTGFNTDGSFWLCALNCNQAGAMDGTMAYVGIHSLSIPLNFDPNLGWHRVSVVFNAPWGYVRPLFQAVANSGKYELSIRNLQIWQLGATVDADLLGDILVPSMPNPLNPTATSVPTNTPTQVPIVPTFVPDTPTLVPTNTPTLAPTATATPTMTPTNTPTVAPTSTVVPTDTPTPLPPTATPTMTTIPVPPTPTATPMTGPNPNDDGKTVNDFTSDVHLQWTIGLEGTDIRHHPNGYLVADAAPNGPGYIREQIIEQCRTYPYIATKVRVRADAAPPQFNVIMRDTGFDQTWVDNNTLVKTVEAAREFESGQEFVWYRMTCQFLNTSGNPRTQAVEISTSEGVDFMVDYRGCLTANQMRQHVWALHAQDLNL